MEVVSKIRNNLPEGAEVQDSTEVWRTKKTVRRGRLELSSREWLEMPREGGGGKTCRDTGTRRSQ